MSTRVELASARETRMTTSSSSLNQRVVATASMRPWSGASATIVQPISLASASALAKAWSVFMARRAGLMSG